MNSVSAVKLPRLDAQMLSSESRLYPIPSLKPDVIEVHHSDALNGGSDVWAAWFRNLFRPSIDDDCRVLSKEELTLHHPSSTRPMENISLYLPETERNVRLDETTTSRDTLAHDEGLVGQHPYDCRHIANWFIRRATDDHGSMGIMRVLKLVYMAHGWTLTVLDRPLIMDRIEAWETGPVIPTVYYAFRPQDVPDLSPFPMYERCMEPEIEELLEDVYNLYSGRSGLELSNLTRVSGGPWARTYGRGNRYREIRNELIGKHYKNILERSQGG